MKNLRQYEPFLRAFTQNKTFLQRFFFFFGNIHQRGIDNTGKMTLLRFREDVFVNLHTCESTKMYANINMIYMKGFVMDFYFERFIDIITQISCVFLNFL